MKLQSFLKILLLSNIVLGQVTLSKEEVRNIANKIDSVVVAELEYQIKTHEETIKLLGKKVTLVKPRWYDNKYMWGIMGSLPAYYIGYLIGKL